MPQKKTLKDVIEYVEKESNGMVKVLSKEYINNKTHMTFRCSCGETFERCFSKLKSNGVFCPSCTLKRMSENNRTPFDQVLKMIKDKGCDYISGEYINSSSKLLLRCACGNEFEKTVQKFKAGQSHCPKCGMKNLANSKTKYSPTTAKKILKKYGYFMEEKDYINASTKIPCKCAKGHDCNIILSQLLVGRSGCKKCANDSQKSFLSHFWNGGEANVQDEIRKSLKSWKISVYKAYNYKCPITGAKAKDCVVHHLLSFNQIVNDVCLKYENIINNSTKIKDLQSYSIFEDIKNEIVDRHNLKIGILISKTVHKEFHKQYGYGNNTPFQFDEFLYRNYQIHLSDIQVGF